MPKFNQAAYNDCDNRAKEVLRNYLDSRGIFTKVFEDYGADIQAFHQYFHEVEVKSAWEDVWPEAWKTLHIPARKKKLLEKGKGFFYVFNKTATKAKIVESKDLDDVFIEIIPNSRYPKGEYFYNIPIDLTNEIIF